MQSRFTRLSDWYWKNERRLSTVALIVGFIIDILTLRRVDMLLEDLWVIFLILLAGAGIIILNYFEKPKPNQQIKETTRLRIHFWTLIGIQFAFGGVMSAFLIFYFRSATIAQSWPFLFLIAFLFIANEWFRTHYSRLVFQISVLFFAIFAFNIFYLPIIFHRIGPEMFILSGAVSILFIIGFLFLLSYFTLEKFKAGKKNLVISIGGIFILINFLYFVHAIPPIPLLLKDIGIYHDIQRNLNGEFEVMAEANYNKFERFFGMKEHIHLSSDNRLYAYSAIFSPIKLNTTVVHEWQYFDEKSIDWKTATIIKLPIVGGRDGGFRTYSMKDNTTPGIWRVNVKTESGQIIGRIKFRIEEGDTPPELVREVKS